MLRKIVKCADCGLDFEPESNETICDDCICNELSDDEDTDPDYWYCNGCGYSQTRRPTWGGQCPKCMAHMEEGIF